VDGLRATHDDLRAVPGSFDAALAALEALRDEGVTHTVNTQINRRNCEELEALGEILFDLDVRAWQFQITTPMGRAADRARLVLQPWHLVEIFPRLAALAGRARTRNCRLVAANNIGYFGPHEGDLRPGGFWVGCPAGRFSLGIQSDGKVKGCASLPTAEWTDLSLRDLPLAHIYAESRALARLRERSREGLGGFCRDCYYAELCVGGCVWMTTTFFGSWGDNPYCHHRALELKGRGLRERVVPRVGSPGGAFDHGLWTVVREPWREQEEEEEKDPADDILMGMSRGVAQEGGGC
jgi:radical SAM protein with 4Fe4S-binding SPASM domain